MADASSHETGSVSARVQEILRRADAQLAPRDDLGELLDAVAAGVAAAGAHLDLLAASLELIARELGTEPPAVRPAGQAPPP